MMRTILLLCGLMLPLSACRSPKLADDGPGPLTLAALQKQAARFDSVIDLPPMAASPAELRQSAAATINIADLALNYLGQTPVGEADFTAFRILDDIRYTVKLAANRATLLQQTHPDPAVRAAAAAARGDLDAWFVRLDYQEDVYRVLKTYADTNPTHPDEAARLLQEVMRDFSRAGLELPREARHRVESLRVDLAGLCVEFDSNINQAMAPVAFTSEELEGVPGRFLDHPGIKTGENQYDVMAQVAWQYDLVIENARREETRRLLYTARHNLAREQNIPVLQRMLSMRKEIARLLGYATWADYRIEPTMVQSASRARQFLEDLKTGLEGKFEAEIAELRKIKVRETGTEAAIVRVWDVPYYANQLKKTSFEPEQWPRLFPYERTLNGMFRVCERAFDLAIREVTVPHKWVDELRLVAVLDGRTGQPLGLLYLDMFPRPGKFAGFTQFPLVEGKLLRTGRYQRPAVALVCNFPAPQPGNPSLLTHFDVQALFQEFGHALHTLLSQANFTRLSGATVPRDYARTSAQLLGHWVWDQGVLETLGTGDPASGPAIPIPNSAANQLRAARLATVASQYQRQIALGLLDLALHMEVEESDEPVAFSNRILGANYLSVPEETAGVASFRSMVETDAGYYGYVWSDSIASDLATVFERDGYLDARAGRRLRQEILEPGNARAPSASVERFLGRPYSIEPFLKELGIGQ